MCSELCWLSQSFMLVSILKHFKIHHVTRANIVWFIKKDHTDICWSTSEI